FHSRNNTKCAIPSLLFFVKHDDFLPYLFRKNPLPPSPAAATQPNPVNSQTKRDKQNSKKEATTKIGPKVKDVCR
ncbi:MAG: hypothetical protein LH618_14950, partial [Saprospiraceae bacterium]|nr:hypothetical protein [Saprospiraceae bacterium]